MSSLRDLEDCLDANDPQPPTPPYLEVVVSLLILAVTGATVWWVLGGW